MTLTPRDLAVAQAVLDLVDKTLREDDDYAGMDPFPCMRTLDVRPALLALPEPTP